ncbi:hypothetical protein KOI35_17665 [Actinoplanes bogorensis]|uniref:Uncharacterized protein n=1 Tax=Paractinoplanes bogorensis TaxID=1610840 RepID=A0ABS5YPF3_9ACTN|nr:hypothetical protein [Actinoplanes bogorensis]MBU2665336.1 hypothetical protein [Actinoplanes bogorensis]
MSPTLETTRAAQNHPRSRPAPTPPPTTVASTHDHAHERGRREMLEAMRAAHERAAVGETGRTVPGDED